MVILLYISEGEAVLNFFFFFFFFMLGSFKPEKCH